MAGLGDLYDRATGALDDYVLDPIRKGLGSYVPDYGPTELPEDNSRYVMQSRLDPDFDPIQSFRRSTQPKTLPKNIPSYRANEKKGGLETLPQSRFDTRSPLKSDVRYWHGATGQGAKPIKAATPEIKQMYAYARLSGAAQKLGLPSVNPQQFAAMVLKEGRPDAGFNSFRPEAKPDLDFRKKINQYNIPEWQKDYLGMLNYAQRISTKKKVPFEAVWNGLGRSLDSGKTGFDYAKAMKAHQDAALHPKNKEFMGFIANAFNEGVKYGLPTVKEKARDTDPQLKSDPKYKYHTPEGRLKPHGINTLFKASGGIVIDDCNPAKQRKLI
jgi:hypothetical protein